MLNGICGVVRWFGEEFGVHTEESRLAGEVVSTQHYTASTSPRGGSIQACWGYVQGRICWLLYPNHRRFYWPFWYLENFFFFFTIWVLLFNGQNPESKAIQKANRTSPKPNRKNQKTREKHKGKAQKRNPPRLHQFTQHVERHLLEPQQQGNTCRHFPSSCPPPEKHELFRRNLAGKHMQLPIVFTDRTSPPD